MARVKFNSHLSKYYILGIIRHYWEGHKKYSVILAYLHLCHGVSARFGIFSL
jgi:hypothetical protein